MKKLIASFVALLLLAPATLCHAWNNIELETNHDPLQSFRDNSPNYNENFYNQTYNYNGNYTDAREEDNSRRYGEDVRDYNPYYDRNGNLKAFD